MEQTAELEINLFGDQLPPLEALKSLSTNIHSSESNRLKFAEQLEANKNATSPAATLATGIALCMLGRHEEAIRKLQSARDCKEKYLYLAFSQRVRRKYEDAVNSLKKTSDLGAEPLMVHLEKAATYRQAGNLDAAAKELATCTNFENVSAEYHYQLARLQEARGEYGAAVANYKAALNLSPNHSNAMFHLAYRYDLSGQEEDAIDLYEGITGSSPVHVSALLNLAILYEDRGDFEQAEQCVDRVLEGHPNHMRALLFKKDIASSKTMYYDEEKEKKRSRKNQILETPISDFELSVRSRNCLRKMNIRTLGDLLNITEAELLSYKNFGETSLREIKAVLESKSLRLGMALEDKQMRAQEPVAQGSSSSEDQGMLTKSVDDIQLSVRSRKCLQKLNIRTLGELTRTTEAELLGCKNFGVTSLNEIKKMLAGFGVSLRNLD
jgi:DNA-directed RNA polymerase subunit alpha